MYNRIELPLSPSPAVGLIAAAPWLSLTLSLLILAAASSPWLALPAPLLLAGAFNRWRRCGSLSHPQAVTRLLIRGQQLLATLGNGTEIDVQPLAESRLTGPFLFLALRATAGDQRFQSVLTPHNTSPEALRRLRVWLRLMPESIDLTKVPVPKHNSMQRLWPGGKTHDQ